MGLGLLNSDDTIRFRNFVLSKSISPTVEATLAGVGSFSDDRGRPAPMDLNNGNSVILNTSTVSSLGEYFLKPIALRNRYNPVSYDPTVIHDVNSTGGGNIGSYLDYARTRSNNDFNIRQLFLGSSINNNDFSSPLEIIGHNYLKFLLKENIAANTIKNTAGRVNTNIVSLLNGEEFLIRDYQITEFPATGLGYAGNLLQKYSGIEIPISIIPKDAFGFMDSLFVGKVNYADCNLQMLDDSSRDTITRNNILLRYTGKGNRVQLFNLLGMNKYRPDYENQNGDQFLNRIFGFLQQQKNNNNSSYDTLEKTRRSSGTLPIMLLQNIATSSEPQVKGAFLSDDARSVLQSNGLPKIAWDNKDNLNPGGFKRFMFSIENLAWIGNTDGLPICEIGNGDRDSNNKQPGRIMWFPPYGLEFDENVSVDWDQTKFIGRGEPVFTYNNTLRSGTISFKVVVDHPSILNNLRQKPAFTEADYKKFFMGCGGKNHPNAIDNALNYLEINNDVSQYEKTLIENKILNSVQKNFKKVSKVVNKPGGFLSFDSKIYFPNASASVEAGYENGTNTTLTTDASSGLPGQVTPTYMNSIDFGLNVNGVGYLGESSINSFQNILISGASAIDKITVNITISNTSVGGEPLNVVLADKRFAAAKGWVLGTLGTGSGGGVQHQYSVVVTRSSNVTVPVTDTDVGSRLQKEGRFALMSVNVVMKDTTESTIENQPDADTITQTEVQDSVTQLFRRTVDLVYKECDYFYFLETNEPFLFKKFSEKIKYFHPGFHSITPEGLNSRLTFLHQCTRQGPALNEEDGSSNLAFGRPPFCILRIGDFFHTKMVIQSMSIKYDDSLWDLNPEGIGVQPRIATVSLSVSYLGGQSLMSPISKLQNALGFNFYANTEVFQHAPSHHDELISETPGITMDPNQLIDRPNITDITNMFNNPSLELNLK